MQLNHRQPYWYKNSTPKQTIPRVFRVIMIPLVDEDRPLISGNRQLPTMEFSFGPNCNVRWCITAGKFTYSTLDQFKLAGHNSAPVRSWWNPRPLLMLHAKGGLRGWPRGVIQSRTALFKLFVSSDQALDAPFWIYNRLHEKIAKEDREKCVQAQQYEVCHY